jgi:hypothetical protein
MAYYAGTGNTGAETKKAHLQLSIIPSILLRTSAREETENHSINRGIDQQEPRTSYIEDRVDALALWTEEGRGDRRNVPGELHASVDPGVSEWGNPSRVMSGDPHLNP